MTTTTQDNWANDAYMENARFVPRLANTLIDDFLVPQPTDTIFDIGCGDGELTAKIPCSYIAGTDSSAGLVSRARKHVGPDGKTLNVSVDDARDLDATEVVKNLGRQGQKFDKVVSNAALHWILYTRDREIEFMKKLQNQNSNESGEFDWNQTFDKETEKKAQEYGDSIRQHFFDTVFNTLASKGSVFAAEMGGLGNVSEICSSFIAVLAKYGFSPSQTKNLGIIPWYFPHESSIQKYLEKAGFKVEKIERVYRSTALPHGENGLKKWAETFGFTFIEAFEKIQEKQQKEAEKRGEKFVKVTREEFLNEVCDNCKFSCFDPQDRNSDQSYINYVRLRWRAVKQ